MVKLVAGVPMTRPVIGYYLGEAVELLCEHDGWATTRFVDDRKNKEWRMWRAQIKSTPWGEPL